MDLEPALEARTETRQRPAIREENLPGHLQNLKDQEQKDKPATPPEKQDKKDESGGDDAQIRRALDLLKGWDVFKQMALKKAS
jgi:hypothetical protein